MRQLFKTTLLLSILTGLFMGIGFFFGGQSGALLALGIAALFNFGMYWFSDKIVLKMQRAKPLDGKQYPQIVRTVQELTTLDGLPMPKLYIVDTPLPNAFATGRGPKHAAVVVTTGIMGLLTDNELKAVLGHELGHVKNRDMLVSTIAATFAGAISYIVEMAFWSNIFGGGDEEEGGNIFGTIALMVLAPIAALLIQMAVSRSRELLADQHGKHLMGDDGRLLASALQKLDDFKKQAPPIQASPTQQASAHLMFANMFTMRGASELFSTHPSTEKRIARLR